MTLPSWLTTKFYTYDKLYHAIGCAAAFWCLWIPLGVCWLCAVLVFVGGVIKEIRDSQKTFFDPYDLLANTIGIGFAWLWTTIWCWCF